MSNYHLIPIHREQPNSAALFAVVIQRIEAMSHRLGGNGAHLKQQVWDLYAKNSSLLGLWAAVKDDQVIGHALGQVQQWDGRWVAWINQVEMDTHAGKALKDTFLTSVENWVHLINQQCQQANSTDRIREIFMVTRRGAANSFDHWSRHAGFDPYLTIYRREVQVS
jgi:hypothetical protein